MRRRSRSRSAARRPRYSPPRGGQRRQLRGGAEIGYPGVRTGRDRTPPRRRSRSRDRDRRLPPPRAYSPRRRGASPPRRRRSPSPRREPSPPRPLFLVSPNGHAGLEGAYARSARAPVAGHAVWDKEGGGGHIYTGADGRWYVRTGEGFDGRHGGIRSEKPHGGAPPNKVPAWERFAGGAWGADSSIKVGHAPPQPPPPRWPEGAAPRALRRLIAERLAAAMLKGSYIKPPRQIALPAVTFDGDEEGEGVAEREGDRAWEGVGNPAAQLPADAPAPSEWSGAGCEWSFHAERGGASCLFAARALRPPFTVKLKPPPKMSWAGALPILREEFIKACCGGAAASPAHHVAVTARGDDGARLHRQLWSGQLIAALSAEGLAEGTRLYLVPVRREKPDSVASFRGYFCTEKEVQDAVTRGAEQLRDKGRPPLYVFAESLVRAVIDEDHVATPFDPFVKQFRRFFISASEVGESDTPRLRPIPSGSYQGLVLLPHAGATELVEAAVEKFAVTLVTTADGAFAEAVREALQLPGEGLSVLALGGDGCCARRQLERLLPVFGSATGNSLPCVVDLYPGAWPLDQQRYLLPEDMLGRSSRDLTAWVGLLRRVGEAVGEAKVAVSELVQRGHRDQPSRRR
eukprot:TRINITY_DN9940_c0_g2_i1.p1 TRINITY_DN9940_c0_g2~~TRINITY_DN9940_c0_g2_i1.p1  ORF type:complete len:654 (+),score=191.85 TRINITY_DN9940_c0_g2_i1:72-1964(+)